MSDYDLYLSLPGIVGNATVAGHVGDLIVDDFDLDFQQRFSLTAGGDLTSDYDFTPLYIDIDRAERALLPLFDDLLHGTVIPSLTLTLRQTGVAGVDFQTITLTNVQVVGASDQAGLDTRLAFSFDSVDYKTAVFDPLGNLTGTFTEFHYDLNKAGGEVGNVSVEEMDNATAANTAKLHYFLLDPAHKFDSTAAGHEGELTLTGYELDLVSLLDAAHHVADAQLSPIYLEFSSLLPPLATWLTIGVGEKFFPSDLTLTVAQDNGALGLAAIETIALHDAKLVGYSQDDGQNSRVALTYSGIHIEDFSLDGTLLSKFDFDLDASPPPNTSVGTPSQADMRPIIVDSANAVFLQIGNLDGGSTDKTHLGQFDVLHFDFDLDFDDRAAGPLIVDLVPGLQANAELLADLVAGSKLGDVVLSANRPATGFEFEKVELTGARLISVEEQAGLATRVAFSYDNVAVTLSALDQQNGPVSNTFNSAATNGLFPLYLGSPDSRDLDAGFDSPLPARHSFLQIAGITGHTIDPDHANWFDAGGFELQLTHVIGLQGGVQSAANLAVSPLTVDLPANYEALSQIEALAINHTLIAGIDFDVVNPDNRVVEHVHLTNAHIDHIGEQADLMARLSFDYEQISVDYITYDGNGVPSTQTFTQDLTPLLKAAQIDFVAGDDAPATEFATTQAAHVQISGIDGNSIDSGFANWFDVAHYQLDIGSDVTSTAPAPHWFLSAPVFSPLILDLYPGNTGLAELISALADGTNLNTITVKVDDPASQADVVETIELTGAHVVGYQEQTGSMVRVAFDYDTIAIDRDNGVDPVNSTGKFSTSGEIRSLSDQDFHNVASFDGSVHAFLKIEGVDGITGDTFVAGHKGEFNVDAYDFNLQSLLGKQGDVLDISTAPLTVLLQGDTSQLTNLIDKTNGVGIPHMELGLARMDGQQQLTTFETISLDNVTILSLTDGDDHIARMTLGYGALKMSIADFDNTGQLQAPDFSIDLKTNDFVVGGNGDDTLDGGGGDDTLYAKGGNDIVRGGAGNDHLIAGSGEGDDDYDGGDGADIITFTSTSQGVTVNLTSQTATGPEIGTDTLINIENVTGGSGNDLFVGDDHDNTIDGVGGIDAISFADTLQGVTVNLANHFATGTEIGTDTLANIENVTGGIGNDLIVGDDQANVLDDGDGKDALLGMGGDDTLLAGFDDGTGDICDGGTGTDTVRIDGTAVQGFAFNIDLNAGTDQYFNTYISIENLIGGTQNDSFVGNAGANLFMGEGGNDSLFGNNGADRLYGNGGNDLLNGGGGLDKMFGGDGNDIYVVDAQAETVAEAAGTAAGTADMVVFVGAAGQSYVLTANVERLTLDGVTATRGFGNTLANQLVGNNGANLLDGRQGNDIIKGLGGSDVITGGVGIDTLTGGAGNDFFVLNAPLSAANRDIITDFNHIQDTFRLENAVMKALGGAGALNASFFFAGAAAHDADDHIIYNQANGALSYDSNGSAAGGITLLAMLTNKPVLAANDFAVI